MQYSLLNRFRGGLLGSLVGKILSSNSVPGQVVGKAMLTPTQPGDAQSSTTLFDWSRIADCGIESLIRCGRLDLEDWVLHSGMVQPSLLSLKSAAGSSETALATLPIALFFHDDQVKLRQHLPQAVAVWQGEAEASEGVLAVAFAIALALTEKLDVATLIPQTIAYLGTSQTFLVQQLEQVQSLIEKGAGLDTTLAQLRRERSHRGKPVDYSATSIALAFYCFLYTPDDFRLSLLRAARIRYQTKITCGLTGALSGVYNGFIGIPTGWQLAANRTTTGIQKLQLADRLLAAWSGVYDISVVQPCQQLAVAAPHVIQPR